jgi:hypothetical protein
MPKFYCFNCGAGTDYTLNKPKVCLKCNQSFVITKPKSVSSYIVPTKPIYPVLEPSKPIVQAKSDPDIVIDTTEEDTLTIDDIPEIDGRSFASVDANRNCSSLTYSQLLKEEKNKKNKVTKTPKVKTKTKKS